MARSRRRVRSAPEYASKTARGRTSASAPEPTDPGTMPAWRRRLLLAVVATLGLGLVAVAVAVLVPRDDRHAADAAPRVSAAPAGPAEATFDDGTPRQRPEFERIAARLDEGEATFFGLQYKRQLERAVTRRDLSYGDRMSLGAYLVYERLRQNETAAAVELVDELWRQLRDRPARLDGGIDIDRLRGLAHLRQAEVENCVKRHNAECCIFPLEGGAVHELKAPARQARDSYLAYLARHPGDRSARWLANVASMAVGDHPGGLPAGIAIPSAAFASDHDVGRFRDVAGRLGVDAFNLCGGTIVDDFDGDGLLDIVTSTIDPRGPLRYFRNDGRGGFEDRSTASRADDQLGGLNCIGADYDDDGDVDVLVLRGAWLDDDGRIRNSLLRNDGGVFTDVTRVAGLAEPAQPTQAAAWGDVDGDGDLDLFVGNESRIGRGDPAGHYPSQLFINRGDGTFVDQAPSAGVTNDRFCKGVTAGDYDNDGDLDLYVSNIGPNRLYRNDGSGTFTDVAVSLGVSEPAERSFATWFFDYDNDGWLDLFVAAYDASLSDVAADVLGMPDGATPPRLYHNRGRNPGDGWFEDRAAALGLDRPFLPMGANFGDLDNDGFLDVYLTTGDPNYESIMPNVMLRNDAAARFQDVTRSGGFGHLQKGHGVAFADLDNDGDQDVYHQLGGFYRGDAFRNALFENPGHGHRFLTIRLRGTRGPRNGYGARITVTVRGADGPRRIHRAVGSVSSFGGSPARQEIGLGAAEAIESVEIRWPASGEVQVLSDVPLDAFIEVTEGERGWRTLELPRLSFD